MAKNKGLAELHREIAGESPMKTINMDMQVCRLYYMTMNAMLLPVGSLKIFVPLFCFWSVTDMGFRTCGITIEFTSSWDQCPTARYGRTMAPFQPFNNAHYVNICHYLCDDRTFEEHSGGQVPKLRPYTDFTVARNDCSFVEAHFT